MISFHVVSDFVSIAGTRRHHVCAPSNLRVTDVLDEGTYIVLEWQAPASLAQVSGYKVGEFPAEIQTGLDDASAHFRDV